MTWDFIIKTISSGNFGLILGGFTVVILFLRCGNEREGNEMGIISNIWSKINSIITKERLDIGSIVFTLVLTIVSYIITLIILLDVTSQLEDLTIIIVGLVLVLALLSLTGIILLMNNYELDSENAMTTLGNNLISISYELMIGAVAIGIFISILTNNIDDSEKLENKIEVLEDRIEVLEGSNH